MFTPLKNSWNLLKGINQFRIYANRLIAQLYPVRIYGERLIAPCATGIESVGVCLYGFICDGNVTKGMTKI